MPFLFVELDKPWICLLVVVHDEEIRPTLRAGILKSRVQHVDFLGLLELLMFLRVKMMQLGLNVRNPNL